MTAGGGYFACVAALCLPSFLFVLGALLPFGDGDLGQILRAGGGMILALVALPLTGLAFVIAMLATLRRTIDWHLKVVIWLTIALSVLAIFYIDAVFRRIGV